MRGSLKHRWGIDQNYLTGITAGKWWRLLRENRFDVDTVYWHRAAVITLASLFNSLAARKDERTYGRTIDEMVIEDPPLFILGYWRTGTTHLHNLLSRDPQFGYPNLYEVVHPGSFLSGGDAHLRRFAARVPRKRPMDDVVYDLDLPQEDECALALSCLRSPDLALNFTRRTDHYSRYLTFDGVPAHELEEWKRTMVWFVKKLALKHRRPLVLKSPPHTARIRLLLEMFPGARFVNIHREPYTVFLSNRHTSDTFYWHTYLQKPDLAGRDQEILRIGQIVFDAYFDQSHLIPPGRLVDVAYEDLEAKPVPVVREIYEKLGLSGFEAFQPRLEAYLGTLKNYRKNRFTELTPEMKEKVAHAWRRAFVEWGYPT